VILIQTLGGVKRRWRQAEGRAAPWGALPSIGDYLRETQSAARGAKVETKLSGGRFDQRAQIQRRSRGGCLGDVVAAEKGSDGADEFGQLRLDNPLRFDELRTGSVDNISHGPSSPEGLPSLPLAQHVRASRV